MQFHIGYRDDSDSGICVFGNRARSSINTGWIRAYERSFVHLVLGYALFHNTTCCPGCVCCSKYRWLLGSRDWLQSNAIRKCDLLHTILFCARTSTYSIGNLVGNYFCCCQGRCGHNPDSWLTAKLSLWNRTR